MARMSDSSTGPQRPRVVVLGGGSGDPGAPDGAREPGTGAEEQTDAAEEATASVGQPAKVMRIGTMIKQLLDEVRSAPLDEAARARLAEVHERSLRELEDGLSPELIDELHRITLPFADEQTPSDAELRIAQAQLVGWLEGLFHGIQTALVAQQMAAQAQLTQMRRALPGGHGPAGPVGPGGVPGAPTADQGPGQYL
ncbi:bacterial proteasome activator family protein [Cellulomonas sp.]|uniref:bacterial proteasome activator family protein n=1 Tax=Cellulomonas sp. TaxID=40001 RepID=UPI0039C888E2